MTENKTIQNCDQADNHLAKLRESLTPTPWEANISYGKRQRKIPLLYLWSDHKDGFSTGRTVAVFERKDDLLFAEKSCNSYNDLLLIAEKAVLRHKQCMFDSLNPCWNNRPSDVIGLHWASGDHAVEPGKDHPACLYCHAAALLSKLKVQS